MTLPLVHLAGARASLPVHFCPCRPGSAVPGPPSGSGAVADREGGATNRPHSRAVCYDFLSTSWFGTGSSGSQCTLFQFPLRAIEGTPGEIPHCSPAKSGTSPSAEEIPLVHGSARLLTLLPPTPPRPATGMAP